MTQRTRYAVQVGDRRLVSDLDTVELVSDALTIPHSIVKHDSPGARWICLRVVDPRQENR